MDTEAYAVVKRLAARHGELFYYLQGEVRELQEDVVRKQFSIDVVQWVGAAKGVVESQGRELRVLHKDLHAMHGGTVTTQQQIGGLREQLWAIQEGPRREL